jgi:bifunctional UDP-N-acetylglucosamine pyrophosphorylase/glucosamine-1-phosphate N-acetyltransferase
MLPVADRPLAAHTADAAVEAGADELILVVGYEGDVVRDYFGSEYRGTPVSYAVQEEQLGTAHALKAASHLIDGQFAVLNGDDLYDEASLADLFDGGPAVGTYRVDEPSSYGVLTIDGGRITGIVEKPEDPPGNRVNVGAYVFPEAARDWVDVPKSDRGEYEITDVLERAIESADVRPVAIDRWLGAGRPWELLEANEWKLGELDRAIEGDVHEDAELRGTVVVETGATVEPGVVIEGPVLIKSGAEVGPNAYIRGKTVLGEDVHVGQSVEVKNSIVMEGSNVPHLSYVGDSVLGRNVNFGAGTNVANLRHDGESVSHTVKGERVSTGRRKFGVVAGDEVKTGINTSLNPGVTLSTGSTTSAGETVLRDR